MHVYAIRGKTLQTTFRFHYSRGRKITVSTVLENSFFNRHVVEVAQQLIGATLCIDGVGGIIVETEAYHQSDVASHSFIGQTLRNASMFGPAGNAYVYRSYGIHFCINIVCERGSAVLIRAIEPRSGIDTMRQRRKTQDVKMLCAGPGRLSQALAVTASLDGRCVLDLPFELRLGHPAHVVSGPRIGISRATEMRWRFGLKNSPFVSRKF